MRSALRSAIRSSAFTGALLAAALGCAPKKEVVKAEVKPLAQAPKPVELSPEELLKGAHEKLAAGDLAGTESALEAYLAKEPKSASALFERGWPCRGPGLRTPPLHSQAGPPVPPADCWRALAPCWWGTQ